MGFNSSNKSPASVMLDMFNPLSLDKGACAVTFYLLYSLKKGAGSVEMWDKLEFVIVAHQDIIPYPIAS